MDLHRLKHVPTAPETAAVDDALRGVATTGTGLVEVKRVRTYLLPALTEVQRRIGWISPGALALISDRLHVPPAEVYGVATFYGMLSTVERPARAVHVCTDIVCRMKGGQALFERAKLDADEGGTWHESPCLGLCEHAPAALEIRAGEVPVERAVAPAPGAPEALAEGPDPKFETPQARSELVLLRRAGLVDPSSLDDYRAHDGYEALRRAFELGPAGVIREITDAKLVGRGGAAFPTGRKWSAVASAASWPHYVVVNADESEPGTFKDRVLLEEDPYSVIEALTVAGFAVGAHKGYIYVRGEYPRAILRLQHAVHQATTRGFLGSRIMGRDFDFEVEIRRGAGAYICGEETALFNSIEGLRGEPRNKPPFPVESGLFGKPTAINNVETLVNVLPILNNGYQAYLSQGSGASTGTKLFCVSGDVHRPGLFEVPFGGTVRELIALAGGASDPLQCVLLGGAAGTFMIPEELDVPLTFEATRAKGLTIGSGVVVVIGASRSLLDLLLRMAAFFRDESCGQCVPCRVGTVRIEEMLVRLRDRRLKGSPSEERAMFKELAAAMRDASICGLGQTAPAALESAISKLGVLSDEAGPRRSLRVLGVE